MERYKGYFDASFKSKNEECRCAFYIEHQNKIIYRDSELHKQKTPDLAEAQALFNLLDFIKTSDLIEKGSTINIYGDAKCVIDSLNRKLVKRRDNKYAFVRKLL